MVKNNIWYILKYVLPLFKIFGFTQLSCYINLCLRWNKWLNRNLNPSTFIYIFSINVYLLQMWLMYKVLPITQNTTKKICRGKGFNMYPRRYTWHRMVVKSPTPFSSNKITLLENQNWPLSFWWMFLLLKFSQSI